MSNHCFSLKHIYSNPLRPMVHTQSLQVAGHKGQTEPKARIFICWVMSPLWRTNDPPCAGLPCARPGRPGSSGRNGLAKGVP